MERLTYWNNKGKSSALPVSINDSGYIVALETICAKLAHLEDLQERGRLVILSEPMIPMMAGDDPMDSDVYCPRCQNDLSGGWREEHPDEWKLCQCPNCGQSIDDCMVVSRAAAQAALERMEKTK